MAAGHTVAPSVTPAVRGDLAGYRIPYLRRQRNRFIACDALRVTLQMWRALVWSLRLVAGAGLLYGAIRAIQDPGGDFEGDRLWLAAVILIPLSQMAAAGRRTAVRRALEADAGAARPDPTT
jgi:hypothetical protein